MYWIKINSTKMCCHLFLLKDLHLCLVTYAPLPVTPFSIGAQRCTYCAFLPYLIYVLPLLKHTHKPCKKVCQNHTFVWLWHWQQHNNTLTYLKAIGGAIMKCPYPISILNLIHKSCQASGVKNLDCVHDQIKVKAIWQVELGLEIAQLLLAPLLLDPLKWLSLDNFFY